MNVRSSGVAASKFGKQIDAFDSDGAGADDESGRVIHILRLQQVCEMTGLCRSSVYQMEAEGRFPKRIKIGLRSVGWIKSDVQDWLRQRIKVARSGAGGKESAA
jgi:prophage regulatory protein